MSIRRKLELAFGAEPTDEEVIDQFIRHYLGENTINKIYNLTSYAEDGWMYFFSNIPSEKVFPLDREYQYAHNKLDNNIGIYLGCDDTFSFRINLSNNYRTTAKLSSILEYETIFFNVTLQVKQEIEKQFLDQSYTTNKKTNLWNKVK